MSALLDELEPLLTSTEVARLLRVDPKTVIRWAASGQLDSLRTPGGHYRFRESAVRAYLDTSGAAAEPVPAEEEPMAQEEETDDGE